MYTVHEAKTNFSRLMAEAEAGKEVIVGRGKIPAVKIVAINGKPKRRKPGRLKGKFKILPSFFDPMSDEELKEWGMI